MSLTRLMLNNKILSNFTTKLFNLNAYYSTGPVLNEGEQKLTNILRDRFPKAKTIQVNDISGGCGSMYEVYVESVEFEKLRTVKQHQLVNEALKEQVKAMHGIRVFTAVPESA